MMDLDERSAEHPAQPEVAIAAKIIASYAEYGLIPLVIPTPTLDVPLPTERIQVQQGTDLDYLQAMARRYAYMFYVEPGPAPGTNTAYFGFPQRALSVNLGPDTNVTGGVYFRFNGLASTMLEGQVQDRRTEVARAWLEVGSPQLPPEISAALLNQPAFGTVTAWSGEPEVRLRFDDRRGEPRNTCWFEPEIRTETS